MSEEGIYQSMDDIPGDLVVKSGNAPVSYRHLFTKSSFVKTQPPETPGKKPHRFLPNKEE